MKYASIDIGTNTLRLLIAEVSPDGTLKPLAYRRAITRLGGGYTETSGIDEGAAKRSVAALVQFKKEIEALGVGLVFSTATSVVRRARNRDSFISEVERRTGIKVRVIEGDEEARLSLLGVLSVIEGAPQKRLVVDIGGGSTEFIAAEGVLMKGAWSMERGVVHLTERHLRSDPPSQTEAASMEEEIRGVIKDLKGRMRREGIAPQRYSPSGGAVFVGTAGTITTLAALDQNLDVYDRARINNYVLKRNSVLSLYRRLLSMTLKERGEVLSLEKGREDLIIPGSFVALSAMEAFGFEEMLVSDAGLLEGIIIERTSGGPAGRAAGGE